MTRRIFFGSPSGSMMTAAITGWPGLDASVLAGKANLLGVGILALQAEFGPGRIDQLNLLVRGLTAGRGSAGCRRRCLSRRCGAAGAALGAAFGAALAFGAAGGGAGAWAWTPGATKAAVNAVAANRAKNRPRGRRCGQDTEIHCGKPFLNGSARNRRRHRHLSRLGGCLLAN